MIHEDELTPEACARYDRNGLLFLGGLIAMVGLGACASLLAPSREPCPPSALASIDMRFATEAIAACKREGADADNCKALPAIRAKYAKERAAYVECQGSGAGGAP